MSVNASARTRGCPLGLGVNLSVTAAGPATDRTSVARVAPAKVLAASRRICIARHAWRLTVHARRHQREICPVSRGMMLQPLSDRLPAGLRFLPLPLPAASSAVLATGLPQKGRATGLPRSADA